MEEAVYHFLQSRDTLKTDCRAGQKIIFFCLILILPLIEILLFAFHKKLFYQVTVIDMVIASIVLLVATINLILGFLLNPIQTFYLHYGIAMLVLSCDAFYFCGRILFAYDIYAVCFLALWIVISVLCIMSICDNIKHDRYADNCSERVCLRDYKSKNPKENEESIYYMSISRYTIWSIILVVSVIVIMFISYSFSSDFFVKENNFKEWISRFIVGIVFLVFGYIMSFAWKLILKHYYTKKYNYSLSLDDDNDG